MPNQTGPRTEEGKQASSQNNRRHGLSTANIIVLPAERPYFEQIESELRNEIEPDGPLETIAFRRLLTANWQMEKCQQREADLIAQEPNQQNEANLEKVRRYYQRWEGSYNSAFRQIRLLQTDRACQAYMNGDAPERFAPLADLPKIEHYARRIASHANFDVKVRAIIQNQLAALKADPARPNPGSKGGAAGATSTKSTIRETNSPREPQVGRNSPCPCGSGNKYKRCCGVNAPPIINQAA
ncbi:MAG: SEC-C domain-containing protein [Bryobacterales bacterium]|nr:SEC-C domain-containing protein [Bryobacterales bacterium]